jgi:hypothetical protein
MVYGLIVVVTSSNDDGSGNLVDTFSYALKQANNTPLIITFALVNTNTINFTGPLIPNVPVGVMIDGGSSTCNPTAVVLDGKGVNGNGLVLNGNNFLRNLWVKGFAKSQITASFLNLTPWVKNRLQCFGASR